MHAHVHGKGGKSEGSLQELGLSLHCVCPRDWTRVIRLSSKYLYLLNCQTGPKQHILKIVVIGVLRGALKQDRALPLNLEAHRNLIVRYC